MAHTVCAGIELALSHGVARPMRFVAARPVLAGVAGLCLIAVGGISHAQVTPQPLSAGRGLTGGVSSYRVQRGDSLSSLGARYGVDPGVLARRNGLAVVARLQIGQMLAIDNRHIVPGGVADGILLNIPQRMVFLFRNNQLVRAYPAAVGRPTWQTPVGRVTVTRKDVDPIWIVPTSIQDEMRETGQPVQTVVPPGPDNPLGKFRIRVGDTGLAIHGTNAPQSIFGYRTHGCVRLAPDNIADLYGRVNAGDAVDFVYAPVLLAVDPGGGVYLEVSRDIYDRGLDTAKTAATAADALGVTSRLDPARVRDVLRARRGVAERVDRTAPPAGG